MPRERLLTSFPEAPRTDRSQQIYFATALCFAIVAVGLFLPAGCISGANESQGRAAMLRFLPFFPVLLTYSGLAVLIGLLQPHSAAPNSLRVLTAVVFAVSTFIYGFAGYRVIWNRSLAVGLAAWQPPTVCAAGLGMLIAVASSGVGALIGNQGNPVTDGTVAKGAVKPMTSIKAYTTIGFGLILFALSHMWLESLTSARMPGWGFDWLYFGILAFPICVTLGGLGVVLGGLQPYLQLPGWLSIVLSVAYGGGAAAFCTGLYNVRGPAWPKLDAATLSGLSVLTLVLVVNLGGVLIGGRRKADNGS